MNNIQFLLGAKKNAEIFGIKHIIILVICVAVIVGLYFLLRKKKLNTWITILFYVGIVSEATKLIGYILMNEGIYSGYLPKTDLPFQLCSIQLIFIAILKFSKNEKLRRILLSFMLPTCLIGGFFAILLPTTSALNSWAITFQFFGYHVAIVTFAIYLLFSKEMKWTRKDYLTALKFLAFIGLIAIYLNSMFYDVVECVKENGETVVSYVSRVNFMYVVDPPVSGLPILNKNHGWIVYMAHYAIIAVLAITLCYIKPLVKRNKKIEQ